MTESKNGTDADKPLEEKNGSRTAVPSDRSFIGQIRHTFFRELPLQNETTTFILFNVLDVFMTWTVIRFQGVEANPVARFYLERWGFEGMIFFKMVLVAAVCVIAQIIAQRRLRTARRLLNFGTFVVALVVIYGVVLYLRHLRS